MFTIKRVLCPTEFTSESDEAVRYAAGFARSFGARLMLLNCGGLSADGGFDPQQDECACEARVRVRFENLLKQQLGLEKLDGLDWEGTLIEGFESASTEIVKVAVEQAAELIVMRSRRRPHAAALLGSTAEEVSRTAGCPVLVMHPGETEWLERDTGGIAFHRILVAYDFSDGAELALGYALMLARKCRADLHVLHVMLVPEDDGPEIASAGSGASGAYRSVLQKLQMALPLGAEHQKRVMHAVRLGKPYREILDYVKLHGIDIICMGASGSNFGYGSLFGSNTDRVLRQAHCPVLVARQLKPSVAAEYKEGR